MGSHCYTANCAPPAIHVKSRPDIHVESCKKTNHLGTIPYGIHVGIPYEHHIVYTWTSYGFHGVAAHMKSIWYLYETHVLSTWNSWNPSINIQVVSLWKQYGTNMGPMWKSFGSHIMTITWFQYEFHKVSIRNPYGFHDMKSTRFIYDTLMVPMWNSWKIHVASIWTKAYQFHVNSMSHLKYMWNPCGIHDMKSICPTLYGFHVPCGNHVKHFHMYPMWFPCEIL